MSRIHGDGRSLTGPEFRDDDGSADAGVAAALEAYQARTGSEHDVVVALAAARLLVPVVADEGDMALPTLVGRDGRRAVPAFTSASSIAAWRADARPVPVSTRNVCLAALDEQAVAVLVDLAGPVPVTISGARLAAIAAGEPVPAPDSDPDVLAAVHAAASEETAVTRVRVMPAEGADLTVELRTNEETDRQALARRVAGRLNGYLPGRLARGVSFAVTSEDGAKRSPGHSATR